jgi:hypothetical protein
MDIVSVCKVKGGVATAEALKSYLLKQVIRTAGLNFLAVHWHSSHAYYFTDNRKPEHRGQWKVKNKDK